MVANFRALMIDFSVMESRLEVASSNISIGVSFRTALQTDVVNITRARDGASSSPTWLWPPAVSLLRTV